MSAVPKGSLVLVTGANGFIATYVADHLLQHGYKVRGTVRTAEKAKWLDDLFRGKYGPGAFTSIIVPDVTAPHAFDEAVKGVSGIAHVASPVSFECDHKNIDIAVGCVNNVLQSATREPAITRFVLTSSSSAAITPKPNTKTTVDKHSWNEEAVQETKTPPFEGHAKGLAFYCASKTLAEQELWRFVREEKPRFAANAVLPNYTLGQVMHAEQFGSTAGVIRGLWNADENATPIIRDMLGPQHYVHVSDIALLHVGALTLDDVRGERIFGFAGPYNFNMIVDAMKKIDPNRNLPAKIEGLGEDWSEIDTASARSILKKLGNRDFIGFEEGLKDCLKPSPTTSA